MKRNLLLFVLMIFCSLFVIGCDRGEEEIDPEIFELPESINAFVTDEIEIPSVEFTEGATLKIAVNDPSGGVVSVENNKFTVTTPGTYIITYTVTLGEKKDEGQVNVIVVTNDTKPTITLNGTNVSEAFCNETVNLVSATAKDGKNQSLEVVITVTDPESKQVELDNLSFVPLVAGKYTVTYKATDSYGNTEEVINYITCTKHPEPISEVPDDVYNSFEDSDTIFLEKIQGENTTFDVSINSTNDFVAGVKSGAYSLKFTANSLATFNIISETIYGSNDLSEVAKISFSVYNPTDQAAGFSIYKLILIDGSSEIVDTYKEIPANSWETYEIDLRSSDLDLTEVYALQTWMDTQTLKTAYLDDIKFQLKAELVEMGAVKANVESLVNAEYEIEIPTTKNGNLTITVVDPDGNAVAVVDNKFVPTNLGDYTITYLLSNDKDSLTKTTTLTVVSLLSVGEVGSDVYNSFETAEESFLDELNNENSEAYLFTRNTTSDLIEGVKSGSYSLKLEATSPSTFNLVAALFNEGNDFREIQTISFSVYNPFDVGIGMSIYSVVLTNGESEIVNLYKEIPAKSWHEFELDLSETALSSEDLAAVYSIQCWIDSAFTELFIDDIKVSLRKVEIPENVNSFEDLTEVSNDLLSPMAAVLNQDPRYARTGSNSIKLSAEGLFYLHPLALFGTEDLSNIEKIILYVYVPNQAYFGTFSVVTKAGVAISYDKGGQLTAGEWNEVVFDFNDPEFAENEDFVIWGLQFYKAPGDFYIDDVTYIEKTIEIPENVNSFENLTEIPSELITDMEAVLNDDPSYARTGNNSLKISAEGLFFLHPLALFGTEDLSNIEKIILYVYVPNQAYFGTFSVVTKAGVAISYDKGSQLTPGEWHQVVIDFNDPEFAENEDFVIWGLQFYKAPGDFYIDDITYTEKE